MNRIALFLLIFSYACTTVIKCDPNQNINIALMDHGRHASLILHVNGKYFRYAYGDWQYYALAEDGVFHGVRALLWPTKAGLGRKVLSGPLTKSALISQVPSKTDEVYFLQAPEEQVLSLKSQLDGIYTANSDSKFHNQEYDLFFVPHPDDYWLFNNSNMVITDWVEEAGCESEELAFLSRWQVQK